MREHITYPEPPKPERQPEAPKFEVFIDWSTYTWSCETANELEEYDGTFSVQIVPGVVHIEWYGIPPNLVLWEAVEDELRSIILSQLR